MRIDIIFCAALLAAQAHSQSQLLDPDFGTAGKVITPVSAGQDMLSALAIQKDGKILAAGSTKVGSANAVAVVRYKTDGTVDSGFGTDGIVVTSIGSLNSGAVGVALWKDSLIVVGAYSFATNLDFAAVRYKLSGAIDSSFGGGDGMVVAPVGAANDVPRAMALQADGGIVLVGRCQVSSVFNFCAARFDKDGVLDAGFDGDGTLITTFAAGESDAFSVAVQGDGKLVVAGEANADFAVARYKSDGSLDSSFGTDGKTTNHVAGSGGTGKSVAIQADKKILVAGVSQPSSNNEEFTLVRFLEDGTVDSAFGTGGKVTTDFDHNNDNAAAMLIQPDKKIVVAGYAFIGVALPAFAVARYLETGELDAGFGTGGKITTDIGAGTNTIGALALQGDGKIVAGGMANAGATSDFVLTRYIPAVSTRAARRLPAARLRASTGLRFDSSGRRLTGRSSARVVPFGL